MDREERMRRLVLDAAGVLWGAGHLPVEVNEYGSYVTPGYKCESSNDVDTVRVEHKMPEDGLTDPGRMTTDEKYLARLAGRDAYAATLRAAGWTVKERTVLGNRPILLATAPAEVAVGGVQADPAPVFAPEDLEIVRLMAAGLFNYQIAIKLKMTPTAYRRRRDKLHARTGTRTPAQLTAVAVREGWID